MAKHAGLFEEVDDGTLFLDEIGDLDLQLQQIADVLIVQPVSKRRFGVDNLFDLLRQSLALVVDDSTPSTSLSVPYSKSY